MSNNQIHNSGAVNSHAHLAVVFRLLRLISGEKKDLILLAVYVMLVGLLSLAVPLAAQALVNTIAAGVFLQPVVVLTLIVFISLLFAGFLRLLKLSLLERIQKRVFARVAFQLARHLPQVKHSALTTTYAPHLANRFFDVISIQKALSKILMDAPSALLQITIGLSLMAFYSPYLLAFDIFIILFLVFGIWVLGFGGLPSSIRESYQKHHVAEWLEEIARCQTGFKSFGMLPFALERTDSLVMNYIVDRRRHFRVLYRQAAAHYIFRAMASAGVLAIGGWLVINRQLSLGQLVAANLIIISILSAIEKLFGLLESYYDLLTAVDKVGYVTDLPIDEHTGNRVLPVSEEGANVSCVNLHYAYNAEKEILCGINLNIESGGRISIVGKSGAGKSTLVGLLCGVLEPKQGIVTIDKLDVRDIRLDSLRETTALVSSHNEVFEGTIEDNVLVGRNDIPHTDLVWALEVAQFSEHLHSFADGIKTRLVSEGRNLSRGQSQRLMIARAVVGRPRLLILDEAFTGVDEQDKIHILDELYSEKHTWTIVDISHDPEVIVRSNIICVLEDGQIIESVPADKLKNTEYSALRKLFPTLFGLREMLSPTGKND
jgi:ABC-type bacteriocin/lantibiotic exporter with double-glycine peptidase domain